MGEYATSVDESATHFSTATRNRGKDLGHPTFLKETALIEE